jgi:hypothetical protein
VRGDDRREALPPALGEAERVLLVAGALDQPAGDERVEPRADRLRGQAQLVRQPPRRQSGTPADATEVDEDAERRRGQAMGGEDALELRVDVAAHTGQAREHADRREVQVRPLLGPGRQQRVHGVARHALARGPSVAGRVISAPRPHPQDTRRASRCCPDRLAIDPGRLPAGRRRSVTTSATPPIG